MPDPWTHALNLDRAVQRDGVLQARVAQEDYEGVKPLLRKVWKGDTWEKLFSPVRSRGEELLPVRVLLGYLRGYFLYREVPENDQAFWLAFLKDLGLEDKSQPNPQEYDRLWEALSGWEETRPHLRYQESGKRDFVGTLDAIFHFRALRLKELKEAFLAFHQTGELPEKARPYERLFRKLQDAVELLVTEEEPPDLEDEEAVRAHLEGRGVYLGEPDPVRLLFNRSPKALKDLCERLGGRKPKAPSFQSKQVRVEFLEAPRGLEQIYPQLHHELLVEGWRVHGKVVLEDGRFKRFSWVPRCTPEGEPIPEEVEVSFGEGERVRFRLHHRAYAVRFSSPVWRFGEPLEVRPIGFDPGKHPLRYFLASGGEARGRPEELTPQDLTDSLVVEVRIDGQGDVWRRIGTLPMENRVRLEAWVEAGGAYARVFPPGLSVRIRVFAGERLVQEATLGTEPQETLLVQPGLAPLRVEVEAAGEVRVLTLPPRGWTKTWWRQGLGFGGWPRGQRP